MNTRGSRLRRVALAVTFGVLALSLSGCSWQEVLGLGWPKGITPEAHTNRDLWVGSVIAALVVGVIVWGLTFWTVDLPPQEEGRRRAAPPVRLQHAAGIGADRHPVPDHLGAVLLHRGGAGEDAAQGAEPRGRRRRHRLPVELEVRLPEGRLQGRHLQLRRRRPGPQGSDGVQARGCRRRTARSRSAPCAA